MPSTDGGADADPTGDPPMRTTMNQPTAPRPTSALPAFLDDQASGQDDGAPIDATAATTSAAEATATTTEAPTAANGPAPAKRNGGGGLAGVLAVLAAGAAAAAGFVPELPALGLTTGALVACAAAFAGTAAVQRQTARLQDRLAALDADRRADAATTQAHLEALAATRNADETLGEFGQALLMMQRQDEKIANLTKAVKMYGTPLMEISGQTTELAGVVQQLDHRLGALVSRVAPPNLEPLAQALARLEVGVAAVAQRLDDGEARKSLFRLEEATDKTNAALAALQRGEQVQQLGDDLSARVERAANDLQTGLARLRDGNLGGLEAVVREIQREMAGVATQVAQIGAAVKGGQRAAPTMAAPTPTATPSEPSIATTTTATTNLATPAPTEAAAPSADGGGGYQTGTRSTGGKNVLGAIAKLKQMKG